jgi:hypothetical protein
LVVGCLWWVENSGFATISFPEISPSIAPFPVLRPENSGLVEVSLTEGEAFNLTDRASVNGVDWLAALGDSGGVGWVVSVTVAPALDAANPEPIDTTPTATRLLGRVDRKKLESITHTISIDPQFLRSSQINRRQNQFFIA